MESRASEGGASESKAGAGCFQAAAGRDRSRCPVSTAQHSGGGNVVELSMVVGGVDIFSPKKKR